MLAAFFVSLLLRDHIYPSGGFSSNRLNWVKPVQESDKSIDPSIFQYSSMRLSCKTSQVRMCSSGVRQCISVEQGRILRSASKVWLWFNVMAVHEVSWHGPEVVHRFTGIRKWVSRWWKRPCWFSKKVNITLSLNWVDAVSRWMFSGPDLLQKVWFVHLRLEKTNFPFSLEKYYFLWTESFFE